jgi:hypothetical protein
MFRLRSENFACEAIYFARETINFAREATNFACETILVSPAATQDIEIVG